MNFRSIAVGVDLGARRHRITPGSRAAVQKAGALAKHWKSRLLLVHSCAADEHWDEEHGWVYAAEGEHAESRPALDELAAGLTADGIEVEVRISPEPAWRALTRCSLDAEADLVMLARRSFPGLDARRLGTVASKVVHTCPGAVWVTSPDTPTPPRRMLAAADQSDVGSVVLETATSVAAELDAELHVIHALQMPLSAQIEGPEGERDWLAQERTRVEAELGPVLQRCARTELHVVLSSPTLAILAGVERFAADLVVLGTVARGGVAGALLGNTAERLMSKLECSLLVVKPADFVCPL